MCGSAKVDWPTCALHRPEHVCFTRALLPDSVAETEEATRPLSIFCRVDVTLSVRENLTRELQQCVGIFYSVHRGTVTLSLIINIEGYKIRFAKFGQDSDWEKERSLVAGLKGLLFRFCWQSPRCRVPIEMKFPFRDENRGSIRDESICRGARHPI